MTCLAFLNKMIIFFYILEVGAFEMEREKRIFEFTLVSLCVDSFILTGLVKGVITL
jgi:hypothetical protein